MARVLESETLSGALPLSDLRVVECGEGVAAAFATKLMAILGAEVIKVERPAGDVIRERGPFLDDRVDPEQSGLFLYLNADKCGVTLNLSDPGDRALLDHLLASADVLVHNIPLAERAVSGMETRSICASHPHLIVTNISAYGERGPRAHYRAYELNVAHVSGAAILAPLNSDRPELPPLKLFGLLDVLREKLNYPDLRRRIINHALEFGAETVIIEDKGSGTSLIQDLRADSGGALEPIAFQPDGDKITRMAAQSAKIECRQVLLLRRADWLDELRAELMQFPYGRYDDQVDSLSQFLHWVSQKSRFGMIITELRI